MIRIKNIYYMLSYAFRVLNQDSYMKIETEEFDNVGDLLACILGKGIAIQLKRGLGKEYMETYDLLSIPTGRILISDSLKQQSLTKLKLACTFDIYTEDNYLNQILKTTMQVLLKSPEIRPQYKKDLKKELLFFQNVKPLNPKRIYWDRIRFHRNNATYKMLINICYLILEGMLLSDRKGNFELAKFIDDQQMHKLYEKFVLEYYRRHYPEANPSSSFIEWSLDEDTPTSDFLPTMKSDITLTYGNKTLIIDTKYYNHTMQNNPLFDRSSIISANLYQIFTYVKNKDRKMTGNVSGLLLYAKTDEEITPDQIYRISGNTISVKTLDLDKDFPCIAKQLNNFAISHMS